MSLTKYKQEGEKWKKNRNEGRQAATGNVLLHGGLRLLLSDT